MSSGRRITLKGFTIKDGKRVERSYKHLDVSAKLRMKGSKKVKVAKRGKP
jgi:hypothetical protein